MKIIKCPCGHEYATKKEKPQCSNCGKRQIIDKEIMI